MTYLLLAFIALVASGLTLYTGFGLATLLLPVFALFLPIKAAVVATAIVHGFNNLFKALLFGRSAHLWIVVCFGLPAVAAAFFGAWLLSDLARLAPLLTYPLGSHTLQVTPVKIVIGLLMVCFALFELLPALRDLRIERRYLPLGGLLSGFFGGLSGHQGALRSAFLAKIETTAVSFVATGAIIAVLIDATRLATYFIFRHQGLIEMTHWSYVTTAGVASALGVVIAKRWLHATKISLIQTITGILLIIIGLTLIAGFI